MRPEPRPDWPGRARARMQANDLAGALDAWQAALAEAPDSLDVVAGLADTAFRLGQWELAEKFHAHLITRGIETTAILATYAACLREQGRYDEAIDLLKTLIGQRPAEPALWEGLGAVLLAKGERDTACIFLDEALRLDPDNLPARFHRGCARLELGELRAGLADVSDCARSFSDPANRASAALTCAQATLCLGDLAAGWTWYEARHMTGTAREVVYDLDLPRFGAEFNPATASRSFAREGYTSASLTPEIRGGSIKRIPPDFRGDTARMGVGGLCPPAPVPPRLFISAEQGLGDEVLFASLLPEIAAGTTHLGIGVEPRLVSLFQRSFPQASVVAHHTETRDGRLRRAFPGLDQGDFDGWATMGDFLATRRPDIASFPGTLFLRPDPARVTHWRGYFDALGSGPKAGLLWKSLKSSALRDRQFSPFEQWRGVLAVPGMRFINLQYGDASAELEQARAAGFDIHTPTGIDLKDDLDDLAALTCALDLIIGPSNATTNIAAACGARVWMITPPNPWLALGQAHYPWYDSVRLFKSETLGEWAPVMADVAAALAQRPGG